MYRQTVRTIEKAKLPAVRNPEPCNLHLPKGIRYSPDKDSFGWLVEKRARTLNFHFAFWVTKPTFRNVIAPNLGLQKLAASPHTVI